MGDPKAAIEFIADYLITIRRDMVSLALVERLQRESGFDLNLAHGDKREKWATKEDLIAKDPYANIDALRDRVQDLEAENDAVRESERDWRDRSAAHLSAYYAEQIDRKKAEAERDLALAKIEIIREKCSKTRTWEAGFEQTVHDIEEIVGGKGRNGA